MSSWRLATFYATYFASLGALLPFWALYLNYLGFTAVQIGQVIGMQMFTKILAPNIWAWIADHFRIHLILVRFGALLTVLSFSLVFVVREFLPLLLVVALFSFFWNAILPQFEAITMDQLGAQSHRYAQIRLWGSAGFVLTVIVAGIVMDRFGALSLPPMLLILFSSIFLASLLVPKPTQQPEVLVVQSIGQIVMRPEVIAFLVVNFLLQVSHGPYYAFYSIYLESEGYRSNIIGALWSLAVVAEILVFWLMPGWLNKWGIRRILLWSLLLSALRWLLIGCFVTNIGVLMFAQVLHAVSFGTCHVVAISFIHHYFAGATQSRGQALYSSLSFGAGGMLGSLYSGYGWELIGPRFTFGIAAVSVGLAWIIGWKFVHLSTSLAADKLDLRI